MWKLPMWWFETLSERKGASSCCHGHLFGNSVERAPPPPEEGTALELLGVNEMRRTNLLIQLGYCKKPGNLAGKSKEGGGGEAMTSSTQSGWQVRKVPEGSPHSRHHTVRQLQSAAGGWARPTNSGGSCLRMGMLAVQRYLGG